MAFRKLFILILLTAIFIPLFAQVKTEQPDEEGMNLFLLFLLLAAIGLMVGAAVIGSIAATLLLLFFFAFISLGTLSISFFIGVYKRSLTKGFKTFIYLVCSLVGMFLGSIGVWLIFRLLKVETSDNVSVITGLLSGLTGGIIMAYIVTKIIFLLFAHYKEKLSGKIN